MKANIKRKADMASSKIAFGNSKLKLQLLKIALLMAFGMTMIN
jgi:hypothetical protein